MRQPEIFVFALCLLSTVQSMGQVNTDSTRQLNTVIIKQSRLNDYVIAAYELPLDSSALALSANGSLTDMLRKQGIGHIRGYGPGGLGSPSFRGTGSSHTAVLWNGINLASPLSGQLDLSLIPAGLFDDASIQTGGSTSLSGNGSIGANIHLNNSVNFNEGLNTTASAYVGSFDTYFYDAGVRFSNKKFGTSTKIFWNKSENDFKFTNQNIFPAETQRREHSAFRQKGLLQQLHWQTSSMGIFSAKFWYQTSRHEIPNPTTIIRASQANEENEFYRGLVGWSYGKENFGLNYQGAFIRQDLDYSDPLTNQFSLNRSNSTIHNLETNFDFKNETQWTAGVNYTWEQGEVDEFGAQSPERNRVALFSAFKIEPFKYWKFAFSIREEFVNGKTTPIAPTISAKRILNSSMEVFANISRNYRLPTFNDLYWQGSGTKGNPELQPELSLGGETGFGYSKSPISFKIVVFSNHVDDWILWSPESGQTWIPQNIKKVWSRGSELQLSANQKFGTVHAKIMGQYSLTKSTNENIYENGNPNEKGKQLLLTPIHEGSITLEADSKKYRIRIVNAYTGEQFNDSDNTPYNVVDDYLITNLWIGKTIEKKTFSLTVTGEVNNLFNVEYQGRPGYPMPGINFKAGLQINFNKPNRI